MKKDEKKRKFAETNSSDILQFSLQLLQLNTETPTETSRTETQIVVYKESNER